MTGRPTLYSEEIAAEVCERLAAGESLRQMCRDEHLPAEATVRLWAIENREGFSARYTQARELGFLSMADEIIEIADDGSNDWIERETEKGRKFVELNHEHVSRSNLRVSTRRWLLERVMQTQFGSSMALTGKNGGPIQTEEVGAVDLARRVAFVLAKGKAELEGGQ